MANIQMLQQQQAEYEKLLSQYGQAVNQFNWDADVYNRQASEYQALVDAYNTNPKVVAYNSAVENYNTAAETYNQKYNTWTTGTATVNIPLLGSRTSTPEKLYNALVSYSGNPSQTEAQRNYLVSTFYPGAAPTRPTDPGVAKPGTFTAVKPELTATAPKDPGFTGQQMKALQGQPTMAQRERSGENELGLVQRVQGQKKSDSIIGGLLQNVRYST